MFMDQQMLIVIISIGIYIKSSLGQLVVLSDCVCPGHELGLECTVVGVGSTLWRGSAFSDCTGNRIVLRHSQFRSGTSDSCNNGKIIGRSINTTSDSDGIKFVSQLIIQLDVNCTLEGRTVECAHISGTQTITVGTHTVNLQNRDPPPPSENVHLSKVDRNRLVFTWDPVQTTCPVVEYKVTAVNCGVCPTATHNTSITCVVDDATTVIDNLCILSIQSVVCGVTGETGINATAPLKAPGTLKLTSVLPYYDPTSREFEKIDIQVMTDSSDVSEGISGSVSSYTFNLTFSNPECGSILINVSATSCKNGVCTLENNTIIRCFNESSEVIVTAFASNLLGDGSPSNAIQIDLDTTNELVFYAHFEPSNNTFICQFAQTYLDKSCIIKYGIFNVSSQSCNIRNETRNSSNNTLTDTVTVLIPMSILTQLPTESELCFVAIGKIANFTTAIEGTFRISGLDDTSNGHLFVIGAAVSVSSVLLLVVVILILAVVIVGVVRKRKQRLNSEENYYVYYSESSSIQEEKRQKAASSTGDLIYSQVNIDKTGKNTTSPIIVDDNRVEYAEINHKIIVTTNNDYEETADDSLSLDSLLIQLRPQVTSEWFKFGLALGVAEEVLNKYLGYPSEECIVEMLDNWLRNHGSKPTWKEVAKALKDIGLLQLAEDILKVYTTGKLPVEVDMQEVPQMTFESEENKPVPELPPKPKPQDFW